MYSITHWPCVSLRLPIIVPSCRLNVVGSSFVSHQIPICRSSRKETRLQSRSGHIATSCRASLFSPDWHLKIRSMVPYPLIHIFVLPAHMKSPYAGGRKFRIRSGLLVMWHVEPESRMNECLSGYSLKDALNDEDMKTALMVVICRPSSHSRSVTSGVGVWDSFVTVGVLDRSLLCPLSMP